MLLADQPRCPSISPGVTEGSRTNQPTSTKYISTNHRNSLRFFEHHALVWKGKNGPAELVPTVCWRIIWSHKKLKIAVGNWMISAHILLWRHQAGTGSALFVEDQTVWSYNLHWVSLARGQEAKLGFWMEILWEVIVENDTQESEECGVSVTSRGAGRWTLTLTLLS